MGYPLSLYLPYVSTPQLLTRTLGAGEMALATSVARKRVSPIMLTPHSFQCLLCAQSETTCGELRPERCGEAPRIIRGKRDKDNEARRKPTWTLKRRPRTKMRGTASYSIRPPCFYIHVHIHVHIYMNIYTCTYIHIYIYMYIYLEHSLRRGRKPASL